MRQENGTTADGTARALEDYLAAAEAGAAPPREEFLARHPELAGDLDACLEALRFIGRAAEGPRSVAVGVTEVQPPEQTSGHLGDFRLIREVGRGGMGVVYEAEQVSLGRRVALKVLPFAATMDPRQLQRFHNEARAAASLDHPHIVHVHAVGCERAVHFYAMQFIEGQTLAAMIAGLRRKDGRPAELKDQPTTAHVPGRPEPAPDTTPRAAASTERAPRDRADFRRVADLGIQAAEALDHAHQLGIVHRDVKPANLLLDGRGGLWVTDFGLAHIQSDAKLTMTGDLVGTLRYMSPEQALAKRVVVDHRTDVYSLGATLYELLTLEPAFGGNDRQELLRQIAFEEPKAPRRLNRAIPAELETIVLKAMEKNPAERYATAKELADDLRRWLEDRPIKARRPSLRQVALKWARRHKPVVWAVAAVLLVALLLGGAAGLGWVRAVAASEAEARVLLRDARRLGQEEKWDEAISAAGHAQGLLTIAGADPGLRREADKLAKDLPMVARLEQARLDGAALPPPDRFTAVDQGYAVAFTDYGLDVAALDAKTVADRVRASGISIHLLEALDDWAYVKDKLRDGTGEPLRALARLADDDPWRQQLRDPRVWHDRAALERLAHDEAALTQPRALLTWLGELLEGADAPEVGVRLVRAAQQRHPGEYYVNEQLAGTLRANPATAAEAIGFARAALAVRPQNPGAHVSLGLALRAAGQLDEAIAEYRDAIRINNDDASAHSNLGVVLVYKGQLDEAIAEVREAIRINKDNTYAHTNLGLLLKKKGQLDEAIAEEREAIRLKPGLAEPHFNLGIFLYAKGDVDGAIAEEREAIRLEKDFAEAHGSLGTDLRAAGQPDEAVAEYREAIRLKQDDAVAHYDLGLALLEDKGLYAEALTHLRRSHELELKGHHQSPSAAPMVKVCEHVIELEPKLPAILSGQEQPANAAERADYAGMCHDKRLYAAAARLYREAIGAKPDLVASPMVNGVCYNAAAAAALAGTGAGEDAARLTDPERAALRRQALDWLRADLDFWRTLLDKDPDKARPELAWRMPHWLRDHQFASVRGPDALAKLPEAERQRWQDLWIDVADLLRRAADKPQPGADDKRP